MLLGTPSVFCVWLPPILSIQACPSLIESLLLTEWYRGLLPILCFFRFSSSFGFSRIDSLFLRTRKNTKNWSLKYTEVQSQQMAFTQSPSLSINPKILNNSFSFTVGYMTNGKMTWWLDGNMAKWPQAYMIIWLYGQKALLPEARF